MKRQTAQSRAGFHRIQAFWLCPQKYAYREILGLQTREESPGTGRGTVFHEAARAYFSGEDWEAVIDALPRRYLPYAETGKELFAAYLEKYSDEDEKTLAIEKELVVHLRGSEFTRRVDRVVSKWQGGKRVSVIRDYKLAARLKDRLRSAPADWALATQAMVGQKLSQSLWGMPFGWVELDCVQSAGEGFQRQRVVFQPRMLETIPRSIAYYYEQERRLQETGLDPWQYPRTGACIGQFGVCDYKKLCDYGDVAMGDYENR